MKFEAAPEVEKIESVDPGVTTELQWENSESTAQVCWHKVGAEQPLRDAGSMIQSESAVRKVANLHVAELSQTGICNSGMANDAFQINVDIKGGVCRYCIYMYIYTLNTEYRSFTLVEVNPPAYCFFCGFVQTAEPSHSDLLSEISDDSIPCTVERKGDQTLLQPKHT